MILDLSPREQEMFTKALKLLNGKKFQKAESLLKKVVAIAPVKEAYLNLGNVQAQQDKDEEAIKAFKQAADPRVPFMNGSGGEYPLALNNLGLMYFKHGKTEESLEYYTKAISIADPNAVTTGDLYWNAANAHLKLCCGLKSNDWALGWKLYQYRFARSAPTAVDPRFERPDFFDYEDTIVVLSEQGLGDKIQFARYLRKLKTHCKNLVVQIPSVLHEVFQNEGYYCVEDVSPYVGKAKAVTFCDLARVVGTEGIFHDWIDTTRYTPRTFPKDKPNIIVEWTGTKGHTNNRNRSTTPEHFLELQRYGNLYTFRDTAPRGITPLNTTHSWVASIEAMLGSDLLITVDTSVAHMCGTIGHPCIMIQPRLEADWRWGTDDLDWHNVWYPTVYVLRNPNSWKKAFDKLHLKLGEIFAQNKQT